jgi:hypothetical protein
MDAKAIVKVGPFARGGKTRILTKAADHDFEAQSTVTSVGIFLPAFDELFLYAVTSKVTSDCLVDRLLEWWESVKERFAQIKRLVINLDNGPENHSHRTQFSFCNVCSNLLTHLNSPSVWHITRPTIVNTVMLQKRGRKEIERE